MSVPTTVHQEDYANFLSEAGDLLQTIEQELFNLKQDRTPARVHTLMRAAHTLKGSAASIQLETVKSVAHVLEDVFRALYNPEIAIDTEIESLLFQAYECLRIPLMAELTGSSVDEADILSRTASVLSQLQNKLGDLFDQETSIPTSAELGFDMVHSMFERGVEDRLTSLEQALDQPQGATLATQLQAEAEVFLGLAESLQLEGFGAIAQTTLAALAAHPDQVKQIASLAIADFRQGQTAVLSGDRTQGGAPSAALKQFVQSREQAKATVQEPGQRKQPNEPNQPLPPAFSYPASSGHAAAQSSSVQLSPSQKFSALLQRLKNFFAPDPIDRFDHSDRAVSLPAPSSSDAVSPLPGDDVEHGFEQNLQQNLQQNFEHNLEQNLDALFDQLPEPLSSDSASLSEPLDSASLLDFKLFEPASAAPSDFALSNGSASELELTLPDPDPSPSPDFSSSAPSLDCAPGSPAPDRTAAVNIPPVPDSASSATAPVPDSLSPTPVVRVNLGQLERLDYLVGELFINQNQQTTQDNQLRLAAQEILLCLQKHKRTLSGLQNWSDLTLATHGSLPQQLATEGMGGFDALEMDRYTDFHVLVQAALNDLVQLELIGESLETQIRQTRQSREAQKRLLTSIQDDLTTTRMQPLGETLNRLPRVLQQLSSAHAKPIDISLSGTDVFVDKAIVEKLYNPLLHLVRNAFDHGIEAPALRRATGKPETGHIHIHAYHQGNRTFIEIQDDGQGIDWQRVAEKAIEVGLVKREAAAELSASQLAEFLFQPGFSTAAQLSDLSGRGIGLDMVRSEVQALKGTISVSSTAGKGTTFTLSLPMSFSITRLLVCQQQDTLYALPINTIQQVIAPHPDQLLQTSGGQVGLRWQQNQVDQMIPIHSLSHLLNYSLSNHPSRAASRQSPIILLRTSEGLWGLQVDQVVGEQELVIRPLGNTIAPPSYVYGCSILNDRQMALVIDPILLQKARYTSRHLSQVERSASASLPTSATVSLGHILLVEDSLTVRHSLARTLQEQGYQVSQAGDGLEGLTYLQKEFDIHLVISDIEMPRMNGFEFLSQLRKTPDLRSIPVILLTSRSSSKYRQFAANLGANAFLNKPYSTEALLPLLSNLINSSTPENSSSTVKN